MPNECTYDCLDCMKILVVSSHEHLHGGGEGRLAFEFAVELSRRHRVVLVYPGGVPDKLPEGARLEVYPVRSVDYTLPALTGGEFRTLFRFLDAFQPDIIHSHTPWFLGAIIQFWAFTHGVPFYFTAHELPSKMLEWGLVRYMKSVSRTGLLHVLTRTYLVTFCRHCTGVVALNQAAARDIRGIGYRGRLTIIPNGRTLALYDGKEPADIGAAEKTLSFMGDILPRKNQKFLVAVLNLLPSTYRLLLVGHDVDHRYRREIDSTMSPDLRRRVTFTGNLPHERVPEHLARTHLWVSASRMEVQSLAVLEALASGTPVLGLANETIDELVDERVGGRLPRDATPAQFAAEVRRLCESDPAVYAELCRSARARALPYDWSAAIGRTEKLYARAPGPWGKVRRGTLALPLLLATAQMLISMMFYLILQISGTLSRLAGRRPGPDR
jgi:1,2-diacylglycerol 3-alpha-glucosyltransferase